jgi:rabenosyn-5
VHKIRRRLFPNHDRRFSESRTRSAMEPRASGSKYAAQSPTYRPYQASNKRLSTSTTASPPLASRSLGSSQNPDSLLASPVALYKKAQSTTPTQSNTVGISNGRRIGTPPPSFPFSTVPSNSSPFSSSPRRSGSPVQSTSTPTNSNSNSNGNDKIRVPYHSAFQPQGMRRDRTDEFLNRRKARGEGKKLEEGRLGRRLEKVRLGIILVQAEADLVARLQ